MDVKNAGYMRRAGVARGILRGTLWHACWAVSGVIAGLAVLPFGSVALSFALLCASGTGTPAVALGLCVSALIRGDVSAIFAAYALTLALRALSSLASRGTRGLFEERLALRMIAAATGALAYGLWHLVRTGFLYYHLFGTLLSVTLAPVGVLLWYALPSGFDDGVIQYRVKSNIWRTAALVGACAAATWALREVSVYGVSLSVLSAMLSTLYLTRAKGVTVGSITGIATGLCVSVVYAPLFAFSAISYSLLCAVSATLGSFSALAVGMSWGIYTDGIASLSSLLPALMTASVLFLVVERLFLTEKSTPVVETGEIAQDEVKVSEASDVAAIRLDDVCHRIKGLCGALSTLAEELDENDAITPERRAYAYGSLLAEIGDEGVCVKERAAKSRGRREREYRLPELSEAVQSGAYAASGLLAVSEYLADMMARGDAEYRTDDALGKRLTEVLAEGLGRSDIRASVLGEGRERVVISCESAEYLERSAERIREMLSGEYGRPLRCEGVSELCGDAWLTLRICAPLAVSFAGRKRACPDESEYCGDSFDVVSTDESVTYAFISDGMGSGREAARTSRICSAFLGRLLPVSGTGSVRSTLELLSAFLRMKNDTSAAECAATVDLCVLEPSVGRAQFYKSGAAPTYVFRDGSLFKIAARTMPVGIVSELDAARINIEILPGDVVVMVSDGVTEGREECPELFEFIRQRVLTHSPDQLADAILGYAEQRRTADDASVVVIKIDECIL